MDSTTFFCHAFEQLDNLDRSSVKQEPNVTKQNADNFGHIGLMEAVFPHAVHSIQYALTKNPLAVSYGKAVG